jgi:hypothetical protein
MSSPPPDRRQRRGRRDARAAGPWHPVRGARPQREALESALALRPAQATARFAVGAATLGLLASYAEQTPLLVAPWAGWRRG